jgi:hypothetical protein
MAPGGDGNPATHGAGGLSLCHPLPGLLGVLGGLPLESLRQANTLCRKLRKPSVRKMTLKATMAG